MTEDPRRLSSDPSTPREIAETLARMKTRGPSPEERARLAATLGIGIGGPGGPSGGSGSAGGGAVFGGYGALIGGAAVVAIGLGAAFVWERAPSEPPVIDAPHIAPVDLADPAEPDVDPRPLHERDEAPLAASPEEPAPAVRRPRSHAPVAPTIEVPTEPVIAADDAASRLREEAALLQRAEAQLATRSASALALTEQHRRDFRDGVLGQEREVIAIDALLRLGRRAEAERRAAAFASAHGRTVHAARVQRLLER